VLCMLLFATWQRTTGWPSAQWWMSCAVTALLAARSVWKPRVSKDDHSSPEVEEEATSSIDVKLASAEARSLLQGNIFAEASSAMNELNHGVSEDWMDVGEAGVVGCKLRVDRKSRKQAMSTVVYEVDTKNQVPEGMKLVEVQRSGDGCSEHARFTGALMLLMDPTTWPEWIPIFKEVIVVHQWAADEFLLKVNIDVGFAKIIVYLYIKIFDHLDIDGSVGAVVAGVPRMRQAWAATGGGGPCGDDHLLGIKLPKEEGGWGVPKILVDVDYAVKNLYPGADGKHHKMRFVLNTDEYCPADWMVRKIFSSLARRIMPTLAKCVKKAETEVKGRVSNVEPNSCDRAALDAKVELFEGLLQRMN